MAVLNVNGGDVINTGFHLLLNFSYPFCSWYAFLSQKSYPPSLSFHDDEIHALLPTSFKKDIEFIDKTGPASRGEKTVLPLCLLHCVINRRKRGEKTFIC